MLNMWGEREDSKYVAISGTRNYDNNKSIRCSSDKIPRNADSFLIIKLTSNKMETKGI